MRRTAWLGAFPILRAHPDRYLGGLISRTAKTLRTSGFGSAARLVGPPYDIKLLPSLDALRPIKDVQRIGCRSGQERCSVRGGSSPAWESRRSVVPRHISSSARPPPTPQGHKGRRHPEFAPRKRHSMWPAGHSRHCAAAMSRRPRMCRLAVTVSRHRSESAIPAPPVTVHAGCSRAAAEGRAVGGRARERSGRTGCSQEARDFLRLRTLRAKGH